MAEITPAHRFVDPGLNYLFTSNYDLSIRILPDGFSYAIFDTLKEKFIAVEEFAFKTTLALPPNPGSKDYIDWLDRIFVHTYLLKEKFNKVLLLVGGIKYTLMPAPVFNPSHARKYLDFNHPPEQEEVVSFDMIKSPESNLVYTIPGNLNSWIVNHFPNSRRFHVCSSLIRNFYMHFRGGSPVTRVLVNVQARHADIVVLKDSGFHYCNSFLYSIVTDLLYYLLFVYEQLKINTEESLLFLSGAISTDSELNRLLKTYIRYVELIPEIQDNKFSPAFDHASLHRYFDILNVSVCG